MSSNSSFFTNTGITTTEVSAVDGLKTAAETAKTAAETAQAAAETAKSGAETAKSGADTSAANAATSATAAASSASAASTSATAAATSATAAAASASSVNNYTGGTGITVSGTTITNDSPDQTVALTAGSNVSVSGTYPNFTISATDTNTTYSVGDGGLTEKNFTTTLKNKLDAVEANATADQTAAEIRAAVEAASDSNVFTDADHSKLDGIAASANNYSLPTASSSTLGGIKIGSGLSIDGSGVVTASGGGGSSLTVQDEGSALSTAATTMNFVGNGVTASGTGATKTITVTDTNTTYSIGDGGLTQNNFTNTLKSKLDGIEANATADQTDAQIRAAVEAATDSNVFTDADHSKLDGIAASANNYVHPNHSGEVTSTADGATVIADNVVDEANLKVSNSPTDGYVLTAQSGNTGGLTWAAASGGGGSGISNLVEDTTPQLGGDLDTNSKSIKFGDRSSSGVNELVFGDGDDLKIFHGTNNHSQIVEGGSGHLQIYASNLQLRSNVGEDYIVATDGGPVELYHNNSKKAETTSSGLQTTGTLNVNGAYTLPTSDGSANQVLTAAGDGTTSWAAASGGGGSLSGNMAGDIASNGHEIKFADSGAADQDRLTFGASDDLSLYHDGSNSYIVESGAGDLRLQANNLAIQNLFGQYIMEANASGGVNQYFNTSLKASTLSDGFAIRGQLKIQDTSGNIEYTLPASDGSANEVLQTNGNGTLSFAAVSGGGADLYAANPVSATNPSAGGNNSIAIGSAAVTTNTNSIAIGTSTDADSGGVAIGYSTHANSGGVAIGGYTHGANANGAGSVAIGGFIADAYASTSYAVAIGEGTDATGIGSLAIGNDAQAASGQRATALTKSYASGSDSLAAAIANNSSGYGALAGNAIALGKTAKANGARATAIGYESLSGGADSVAIGRGANASSENSLAFGYKAKANVIGCAAFSAGIFGAEGDAQGRQYILRADTTDATATVLTTDNGNASVFNSPRVDSDTAIVFDGVITAMQNGAQAYAGWRIEGMIVNDGGTTTLVNSATTVIQNSSNWGMALSADNNNNILKITATGEAAHNIRWVANIRTVETTFA